MSPAPAPPTDPGTPPVTSPPPVADPEIRFALAMNGGVSLAVWIGGVSDELLRLCRAGGPAPLSELKLDGDVDPTWSPYEMACWAANLRPRVDVMAGASAGGMNSVFLALGLVYGHRNLTELRNLWLDAGSFEALLRDPLDKEPPSLLKGDSYFLVKLEEAISALMSGNAAGAEQMPIDIQLTVTSMSGVERRYPNRFGDAVVEREHGMTLRFRHRADGERSDFEPAVSEADGDARSRTRVVKRLARACRSTASFPGAFEPSHVTVMPATAQDGEEPKWDASVAPDTLLAHQANFTGEAYLIDGGTLVNLPVEQALESVLDQPASGTVRRVFGMVVPDPSTGGPTAEPDGPPALAKVVTSALSTIPRNQTVGRFLEDLRDRNDTLRHKRVARLEMLRLDRTTLVGLARATFDSYRARRIDATKVILGRHLEAAIAKAPIGASSASAQAWRAELEALEPPWIPTGISTAADLHRWGKTAVRRSGARLLHLLVELEERLRSGSSAMTDEEVVAITGPLRKTVSDVINRMGAPSFALENNLLSKVRFDRPVADESAALRKRWSADRRLVSAELTVLGGVLQEIGRIGTGLPAVDGVPVGSGVVVLQALEVLENTFGGFGHDVEQMVETVRIDSIARSPLDSLGRGRADGKVAGVQLGHFGSFLRMSWRANDWMWGRLDGSSDLIEVILHSAQHDRLARLAPHLGLAPDRLVDETDDAYEQRLRPLVHTALVERHHADIVLEETAAVIDALADDEQAGGATTRNARALQAAWKEHAATPRLDGVTDATERSSIRAKRLAAARTLLNLNRIGSETIADEAGSDLLTKTSLTALATGSSVVHGAGPKLAQRPIAAIRYVALLAWGMTKAALGGSLGRALSALAFGLGAGVVATELAPGTKLPGVVVTTGLALFAAGALVSFARAPIVLVPLLVFVAVPLGLTRLPADPDPKWWPDGWPYPSLRDQSSWVPVVAVLAGAVLIGMVRRPPWLQDLQKDEHAIEQRWQHLVGAWSPPLRIGARHPVGWLRWTVLGVLLVGVVGAKSWQIITGDRWLDTVHLDWISPANGHADVPRQIVLALVVVVTAWIVVRAGQPAAAMGLTSDQAVSDDRRWFGGRVVLGGTAVVVGVLATTRVFDWWLRWVALGVSAAALVALIVLECLRVRGWRAQPWKSPRPQLTVLWVTAPLALSTIATAVAVSARDRGTSMSWGELGGLALVTALGEELIFRGALLALAYRVCRPRLANVLVALSFGTWHVGDAWNVSQGDPGAARAVQIAATVIATFVAGLVLVFVRRRSRSLAGPVLAHMAANLPGLALGAAL